MSIAEPVPKDSGTVLAEERTDLALRRTLMAGERTLMAWIRTALSMIGFGFSIYKFFQYLPEEIAAGNIQRPLRAAKSGAEPHSTGHTGIGGRCLAASEVSEGDASAPERGMSGPSPSWWPYLSS